MNNYIIKGLQGANEKWYYEYMKFHAERELKTLKQLELIRETTLPPFCGRFFLGISQRTSPLTRLNYAYDLRIFFEFLTKEVEAFHGKDINSLAAADLEKIETHDIELFIDYLASNVEFRNGEKGIIRKLSCLRAFFKYYFKMEMIKTNIMPNIELPKLHDKPITRLSDDETVRLLDAATGEHNFNKRQTSFVKKTELRDTTIMVFFLTTGVRISELVGLNHTDIDMKNGSFRVTRKGGYEAILYMPEDLIEQLERYLSDHTVARDIGKPEPFFKSSKGGKVGRISVRAVQHMIKKYASSAVPLKNISPHKLRSTFGTQLYRETKDIYVVADVLGHRDVNTTKKHYAALDEDVKRDAARQVKLRN
jgi:site-specific recombinase XerD